MTTKTKQNQTAHTLLLFRNDAAEDGQPLYSGFLDADSSVTCAAWSAESDSGVKYLSLKIEHESFKAYGAIFCKDGDYNGVVNVPDSDTRIWFDDCHKAKSKTGKTMLICQFEESFSVWSFADEQPKKSKPSAKATKPTAKATKPAAKKSKGDF